MNDDPSPYVFRGPLLRRIATSPRWRPGLIAFAIVALAMTGSLDTAGHWVGEGIHVVDDFVMTTERPCDPASPSECVIAVRAAQDRLGVDPGQVKAVAIADGPDWADHDDRTAILHLVSGGSLEFVILDLVDGSRRAVEITCWSPGNPIAPAVTVETCQAVPSDFWRVGHVPEV